MFHKMPIILVMIIAIIILFGQYIPLPLATTLFTISLSIKSIIIFLLPIIIFSLLFKAASSLASNASKVILFILVAVVSSNFIITILSKFIGHIIYGFDLSIILPNQDNQLQASSFFTLEPILPNYIAMILGVIMGILTLKLSPEKSKSITILLEKFTAKLLQAITVMIPLFVTGFAIKLQYDGVISKIIRDYTSIFIIVAIAQYGYIIFLYYILDKFSFRRALISIKNMLPATISGFSTMSSAASMPLMIIGTEKNSKNKDLVHTVVPATVNIHLIGDCIAIPCFAYAVLKNYGQIEPTLLTYLVFTAYFVMAKFSVAAIPGGGIIVMLPILEQQLGFNSEMLSLITALYILFDPVITSSNVIGNGAFAKAMDKMIR